MKQLVILSGKGGTGKTTLAASFVFLAAEQLRAMSDSLPVCFADCDVDVPNLQLIFSEGKELMTQSYYGLRKAVIDQSLCTHCGTCDEYCRFDAVKNGVVNTYLCDGCGVCVQVCPKSSNGTKAVKLENLPSGDCSVLRTKKGVFSTATLKIGGGTTGKLVNQVKQNLVQYSSKEQLMIVDGSPGIGCPVVASVAEADMVLIVTEPSVSGISDLQRIVDTVRQARIPILICINRANLCQAKRDEIFQYCQREKLDIVGEIPNDPSVMKATNHGRAVVEYDNAPAAFAIQSAFEKVVQKLELKLR